MPVKFVSLKREDLKTFKAKFYEDCLKENMLDNIEHTYRECFLLTFGEKKIAICGINYTHGSAGDLWMIPSVHIDDKPGKSFHEISNLIDSLLDKDMHRLQMYIKEDWPKGHKWARALKFSLEGIARNYDGKGNDFACYAKVRV